MEHQEKSGDAVVALDDSSDDGYHSFDLLISSKGKLRRSMGVKFRLFILHLPNKCLLMVVEFL